MSEPVSPVIVAAAVIRAEVGGPILLTRRMSGVHLAGCWEFPGGKLEPREDPEAAVARECLEELALEIEVGEVLDVAWHAYDERDVLLIFYDCRVRAGVLTHLGVADSAWVDPAHLDRYDLPPPDRRLVQKLRAGRSGRRPGA